MARSHVIWSETAQAAVDLSGAQYTIVRLTGAGTINIASEAVHSSMWGVLQNRPVANVNATVGRLGLSKIVAGGALTVNAFITTNGSGRAAAIGSAQMCCGRVIEAAGADGDIVTAEIFPPFRWTGGT